MKRFHVHLSVADLAESVRFYSALFGIAPAVLKPDYAKWLMDEPALNFAVSSRGAPLGVNHLGFQHESDEQLRHARRWAQAAELAIVDQIEAACCYARSDKYWIEDPQGVAWEAFHTLGDIPVFGAAGSPDDDGTVCISQSGAILASAERPGKSGGCDCS